MYLSRFERTSQTYRIVGEEGLRPGEGGQRTNLLHAKHEVEAAATVLGPLRVPCEGGANGLRSLVASRLGGRVAGLVGIRENVVLRGVSDGAAKGLR